MKATMPSGDAPGWNGPTPGNSDNCVPKQDPKMAVWFKLNRTWKSKMETPDNQEEER